MGKDNGKNFLSYFKTIYLWVNIYHYSLYLKVIKLEMLKH